MEKDAHDDPIGRFLSDIDSLKAYWDNQADYILEANSAFIDLGQKIEDHLHTPSEDRPDLRFDFSDLLYLSKACSLASQFYDYREAFEIQSVRVDSVEKIIHGHLRSTGSFSPLIDRMKPDKPRFKDDRKAFRAIVNVLGLPPKVTRRRGTKPVRSKSDLLKMVSEHDSLRGEGELPQTQMMRDYPDVHIPAKPGVARRAVAEKYGYIEKWMKHEHHKKQGDERCRLAIARARKSKNKKS